MAKQRDNLVWIDCEMTGLDPEQHVLLEIATIVTNYDLEIIAEGPVLAIHQPERELKKMDNWCRSTHGRSGLTERVRDSTVDLAEAQRQTLKFIRKHCYVRTAPLCGNSVGQDKRFLVKYMPKVEAFLNYRIVDVSSIKLLASRWYDGKKDAPKKEEVHLALNDIKESIEELRFYRQNVFVKK